MGLSYCQRSSQQRACLEAFQAAAALSSPGHCELGISSPGVEERQERPCLVQIRTQGITRLHIPVLFSCLQRLTYSVTKLMSARRNRMLRTPDSRTKVFPFELKPGEERSYQC